MVKVPANYLELLADKWEPQLRDAFLRAISGITNTAKIDTLARLLKAGDLNGALHMLNIDPAQFNQMALVQQQTFNEGGTLAAARIPATMTSGGYRLAVLFNVRNPRAEAWIRERSSNLIQEIVNDQRLAVRNWLTTGLERGLNPRTVALDLVGRINPKTGMRSGGVVGLHSTQEQWLANYSRDLASSDPAALRALLDRGLRDKRFDRSVLKAIREGTGLPPDIRAKMQQAYANKALKWRGDSIAREETMKSLGAAQTEAWQQAIDDGKVEQRLITRTPVTAGDERVRRTHVEAAQMNAKGVSWGVPYNTPMGPKMSAPYEGEIMCRCHERIRISYLDTVT